MTPERLVNEMDAAIKFPGVTNAWTMPIKTRTDMLSTGIRTPVGIKVAGPNLQVLQDIGKQIEDIVRKVPNTRSVFAERAASGNYADFEINRQEAARYGLTVDDVHKVIETAMGGMTITTTVEGLERYPVNLRYPRELRDNPEALNRVLIPTPTGEQVPITQLATLKLRSGPMVVRSEDTRPNAWIYVDIQDIDLGTYVAMAKKAVAENVKLPAGYSMTWSGQYEYMQRAKERLFYVIPATIFIILLIIYVNTRSMVKTAIVFSALPLSLVGAFWYLFILGYNTSIAVWVGVIALAGLGAETGVVMLLYLDIAYDDWSKREKMRNMLDLQEAVFHGAVQRVRPKIMTVATIIMGLLPIMWSHGAGSDVMKRIAAPMIGGVISSAFVTLAVYPAIYMLWRGRQFRKRDRQAGRQEQDLLDQQSATTTLEGLSS